MVKTILVESITQFKSHGYDIRVWREENHFEEYSGLATATNFENLLAPLGAMNMNDIAALLLNQSRVNAVEVKNGSGCGIVVYADWP